MDESQNENLPARPEHSGGETETLYHFSKRVFFLSVLFLMINIAWVGLVTFGKRDVSYHEVAPRLIFASNQDVQLKTPFDEAYLFAQPAQTLLTGSLIKTGEQSFAEIQIEGNVVRLDQNTEIRLAENNFQQSERPRFVFDLLNGSLWVNAFDPIAVETDQGRALFEHSVGLYTYIKPLNRLLSIIGNVDLTLLNEEGDRLSQFVLPLKNQVTFVNAQLIPEYARVHYSKLKKELKMGPISQSVLEEDWVRRNTADDALRILAESDIISSASVYHFKNRYHTLRSYFALVPGQKRMERLTLAELKLKYALGGVHVDNDNAQADTLLAEFDVIAAELKGDPLLNRMIDSRFYVIRSVSTRTPAYRVKEHLRGIILARDLDLELLRTYFADVDYLLRIEEVKLAEQVADTWFKQWKPAYKKDHSQEFDRQARIYHQLMLGHSNLVSRDLLAIMDLVGDDRLENAGYDEEVLFEIALERLEMSKYLVAAFRYPEAKTYLKTSYDQLNLAERETSAAARDVFIQDATLLADRIAFAEQSLRGAAEPVDDAEFQDYLTTQERDKSLAERFETFLEGEAPVEEEVIAPTVDEVIQRFTVARIVVLDEDVEVRPESLFEFEIKSGRFVDRAVDGSSLTFTARYDFVTNAVYEVVLNDKSLKGGFALDDFVRVAKAGETPVEPPELPESDIEGLTEFLIQEESEEAERSQVIAQDLAIQLMIKELESFNILIPSTQPVTVLNPATLSEFRVNGVYIEDLNTQRRLQVSFDYSSVTKMVSNIILAEEAGVTVPSSVSVDQFALTVFNTVYGKEEETQATREVINEFSKLGLLLKAGDFSFTDSTLRTVNFAVARLKIMPIEFEGVYHRTSQLLKRAEHPLLLSQSVMPQNYLTQLAQRWVVDYLNQQGIMITAAQIKTPLPAERVKIENYERGTKIFDFTFDVNGNRLINIELKGTDAQLDSMTFEEFGLVEGD